MVSDGTLAADNTDWIGIRNLLRAAMGGKEGAGLTALVMGGGGTARGACYALQQLGIGAVHVYNRSTDKAAALAAEFGGQLLAELDGASSLPSLHLIVSCVPGAAGLYEFFTRTGMFVRTAGCIATGWSTLAPK